MDYTCILFGAVFIIAGIVFAFGKIYNRLSAWKNMSEKERKEINIVPLCRNIGLVIVLSGIIFLVKGLWSGFSNSAFIIAMVVWLILAGVDVWYISKSKRYRNS